MGREKKILLGLLGLLAGVFLGVLSMKLLVPRPPTGTGPDIRADLAATTAQERVEPPAPSSDGWDFAAAPPLVPEQPVDSAAEAPPAVEPPRFSRFAAPIDSEAPAPVASDVAPASWQEPADDAPPADAEVVAAPPRFEPPLPERFPATSSPSAAAAPPVRDPFVAPAAAARSMPVAGEYLVEAGDSWWNVAERAYGDGRLYRALFAWNRARDRRVSLTPGTRLDVPPLDRLQAAWPRLASPR
jgi:5'-nucleotidase/UDP-sugar diphosphatase